jgi:hypothetical protein
LDEADYNIINVEGGGTRGDPRKMSPTKFTKTQRGEALEFLQGEGKCSAGLANFMRSEVWLGNFRPER